MSIPPLMPVYPRCDVRPVRGEGCHLVSEDGTRYLDFAAGIAVNLLGHSHPGLIEAIQKQAETLSLLFERKRCDKTGPIFVLHDGTEYPW